MRIHTFKAFVAMALVFLALIACSSELTDPDVGDLTGVPGPFDIDAYRELRPEPQTRSIDLRIDTGFDEHEKLPRDAISPIYTPKFIPADEARLTDDELVLGVEINGDARAMPVGLLRFREGDPRKTSPFCVAKGGRAA